VVLGEWDHIFVTFYTPDEFASLQMRKCRNRVRLSLSLMTAETVSLFSIFRY